MNTIPLNLELIYSIIPHLFSILLHAVIRCSYRGFYYSIVNLCQHLQFFDTLNRVNIGNYINIYKFI